MRRTKAILLAGGLAALAAPLILVLSWPDEPRSDAVNRLLQRPIVADDDNAYFALLGFNAPVEKDPVELGKQVIAQYQTQLARGTLPDEAGWPNSLLKRLGGGDELRFSENILGNCTKDAVVDVPCVLRTRSAVEEGLKRNSVLLDRYVRLLQRPKLATPTPGGIAFFVLPFAELQRAKLALWAKVMLLAQDGRDTEALALLGPDVRFWRALSSQADSLLVRMVAVAMLQRQYELLGQMARHFPGLVATDKDALLQMAAPFSAQELSFRSALSGEVPAVAATLAQIDKLPEPREGSRIPGCVAASEKDCIAGPPPALWSLDNPIWRKTALYRPNATLNLQARLLERWIALSEMPPQQFAEKKESYGQALRRDFSLDQTSQSPYNLLGKRLVASSLPDLGSYLQKTHDVSGLTSLVNLQIQITALGIPDERIGPFLQTSDATLANPYTGEAMQWDPKTRSLYFKGRGSSEGGEIAVTLGKSMALPKAR